MNDLMSWWRGVLDEREQQARSALWSRDPERWRAFRFEYADDTWIVEDTYDEGVAQVQAVAQVRAQAADSEAVARFIAANDPASVLAQVAADRKLLDAWDACETGFRDFNAGYSDGLYAAIQIRAEAYAEQPGYREGWRP